MSATNRGKERIENDFYPTPSWCTRALLKKWPPPFTGGWLEPCFGDGEIIRAATEFYGVGRPMPEWTAVELRPECNDLLKILIPQDVEFYCPQDFLTWNAPTEYSVCITNPPYLLAEQFIRKSMQVACRTAMLLRLNFLGSQERAEFHKELTPDLWILPKRPKFMMKGTDSCEYAWFTYPGKGRWHMLDI